MTALASIARGLGAFALGVGVGYLILLVSGHV